MMVGAENTRKFTKKEQEEKKCKRKRFLAMKGTEKVFF